MRYHVRVMKASLGRIARPAAAARWRLLALLAGQLISWTGNRISAVALPLLVIERYGVGLSLGLIAATRLVPRVLLGPWAGALVDRLPRRATVAAANVASAGLVALIPFTTSLPQLYLLGAALGVVETLLRPASFALLPEVFPRDDLYRVNAAQEIIDAVSNLAGPALAIALVTGLGVGGAFAVDAASFLLAALRLAALRPLPAAEHPAAPAAGRWPPAPARSARPGASCATTATGRCRSCWRSTPSTPSGSARCWSSTRRWRSGRSGPGNGASAPWSRRPGSARSSASCSRRASARA